MKLDIVKIKDRISCAPMWVWVPVIVLSSILALAGARLVFGYRAPVAPIAPRQTLPVPAVSAPAVKSAAEMTSAPIAPAASVATPTADAPTNALMIEPPTPGVAEPTGLAPMKARYTLESASTPAINVQPVWTEIGHKLIDSRTASFQTLSEKDLGAHIPSNGLVRESWSFWVHVDGDGEWTTAFKAGGYYQTAATVEVDGRDVSALMARPGNDVSNTIATLRLGEGWHQVTIRFVQQVYSDRRLMHGTVDLYWRGPTDAQPVAIIPSAVAEVSKSTDAPASVATAGGAK